MHDRKIEHIELAAKAQMDRDLCDPRFYYEPLFVSHREKIDQSVEFLGKKLQAPIWISSMTGGTDQAYKINQSLAQAASRFGLGMGLGSLRPVLENRSLIKDFDIRSLIGEDLPLMGNLGIAQVQELLENDRLSTLHNLVEELRLDGICIHLNPLQEWFQQEGDSYKVSPFETLEGFLLKTNYKVIVKEVGQGMGPKSLEALMRLPIAAIEFGAFGGTNFSKLEMMRDTREESDPMVNVGHLASEMVEWCNDQIDHPDTICKEFIISGGVKNYLDGYHLIEKCRGSAIYGQAGAMMEAARNGNLNTYITREIEGLEMSKRCLVVR